MKTITLSGPGKNALSTSIMQFVIDELKAAGDEPVLITGAGDTFSAGLNLKEIVSLDDAGLTTFLTTLEEMVVVLYEYPGPTAAWVNGHAIAGGCVVALCCDSSVMTSREGARIGLNETAIGLKFPPKTFAMIKARLNPRELSRVVLEAALHDAKVGKHLGLVDEIGDEIDARARLDALGKHSRAIYTHAKRASRAPLDVSKEQEREFREETIAVWSSPEIKARLRAALEKK